LNKKPLQPTNYIYLIKEQGLHETPRETRK
jgi:hypothetical protein